MGRDKIEITLGLAGRGRAELTTAAKAVISKSGAGNVGKVFYVVGGAAFLGVFKVGEFVIEVVEGTLGGGLRGGSRRLGSSGGLSSGGSGRTSAPDVVEVGVASSGGASAVVFVVRYL